MLIDQAAVAFREAHKGFTKKRSLVHHNLWVVHDEDGNRYCQATGVTFEQADAIIADLRLKRALTAAISEMISVRILTVALINCGAPPASARALASSLLPAIINLGAEEDTTQ